MLDIGLDITAMRTGLKMLLKIALIDLPVGLLTIVTNLVYLLISGSIAVTVVCPGLMEELIVMRW